MKEDLINLRAIDESTGKPIAFETSEIYALYFTEVWYQDPIYKELLFSSDLKAFQANGHEDNRQEEEHYSRPTFQRAASSNSYHRMNSFEGNVGSPKRTNQAPRDTVNEIKTLINGLQKKQSLREVSGQEVESNQHAHDVQTSLMEFKKATLARMGLYIPSPQITSTAAAPSASVGMASIAEDKSDYGHTA
jgi:hypothetical protein